MIMESALFDIESIDIWLDKEVDVLYRIQPLAQDWARISKISEELGEAVQAYIGFTGQNPRKGVTNKLGTVLDELADVVMTGLLAIQHFTKDINETDRIVAEKLDKIVERVSSYIEAR